MDVTQVIEQAIAKAVRDRISGQIETFVKNEVVRELNRRGIDVRRDIRERNNRNLTLVEGRNLRRKIGSLVMDRVKDGINEQLRFKLNGVKARNQRDAIDSRELSDAISKAIRTRIGKLRF